MRRALKTLGVNFLEFDESGDSKKNSCEKVVGCRELGTRWLWVLGHMGTLTKLIQI